jgi:hypothetical protein
VAQTVDAIYKHGPIGSILASIPYSSVCILLGRDCHAMRNRSSDAKPTECPGSCDKLGPMRFLINSRGASAMCSVPICMSGFVQTSRDRSTSFRKRRSSTTPLTTVRSIRLARAKSSTNSEMRPTVMTSGIERVEGYSPGSVQVVTATSWRRLKEPATPP